MLKIYAFHNKFSISDPKSYVKLVPDLWYPKYQLFGPRVDQDQLFLTFSSSERFFMGIRSSCSFCLEKAALLCHFQPPYCSIRWYEMHRIQAGSFQVPPGNANSYKNGLGTRKNPKSLNQSLHGLILWYLGYQVVWDLL